jgi:hypothetical protein
MTTQKKLQRTSNVFGTVAIATVLGIAGIAGGIQFGTITLVGGVLMALPTMMIGLGALALHVAANNKLQTK